MEKQSIFAGDRVRGLRLSLGLRQADMATRLGISTSYLSQIEHDDRPLTGALVGRLARDFGLEWDTLPSGSKHHRGEALRRATAEPPVATAIDGALAQRIARQQPQLVDWFIALHSAYRQAGERLLMLDEAIASESVAGGRLPWEEVRDWFHDAGNYVDLLDRAAESLAAELAPDHRTPSLGAIEARLREQFGLAIDHENQATLRRYDSASRRLTIDSGQTMESQRFQLAYQLVTLTLVAEIEAVVESAGLAASASRQLLAVGLANYAAGALLMPYGAFRAAARAVRHDIDRLRQQFDTSFEQTCHRLSTLQRAGARGLPFFFCRVDMAGNITKRHSATRLQFARFGGACPLWIVHEAVAIPDRILVQLAETPDGVRYVSMAKGLVKPSGSFDRITRRYAVALGCEATHAAEFVYADGLDLSAPTAATPIGISCRICPRDDCDQRAFPPSDRTILVNPNRRGLVPYTIS